MKMKLLLLCCMVGIASVALLTPEVSIAALDPESLLLYAAVAGVGHIATVGPRELREKRSELVQANRDALDAISRETDKSRVAQLEKEWDARDAEILKLDEQIEGAEAAEGRTRRQADLERELAEPMNPGRRSGRPGATRGGADGEHSGFVIGRDEESGQEIRAYRHDDRLGNVIRGRDRALEGVTLGVVARGLATGRWPSQEIQHRALSLGTPSAGGYTVPASLWADWIDLARANMVCSQAGAVVIPMDSATLQLAKLDSEPAIEWKSENSDFTPADHTFDRVLFTAKTAGVLVKASEELIQDSSNAADMIDNALRSKAAAEMDRVMLAGSGSGAQPTGIRYTNNVGAVYLPGAYASNYDPYVDAVLAVRAANFEPGAVIMAPRTAAQLGKLKDSTNQPMLPPADYANLRKFTTTGIPVNLESEGSPSVQNTSYAIVGDFKNAAWGVRLNPTLLVSREAGDQVNGAMRAYQIWIRLVFRVDVQIFRPAAFAIVHDIPA